MLRVIDEKTEIQSAQKSFLSKMNHEADKQGEIIVGHQGKSKQSNVYWSSKLAIWWVTEDRKNRFWNVFGTQQPKWDTHHSHSIICEINPPHEGINRRMAGVFAKDPAGKLYLLHRGKIGGGKKGVGKSRFWGNFRGKFEEVEDGKKSSKLAIVTCFDDSRFAEQVAVFVHECERIKASC